MKKLFITLTITLLTIIILPFGKSFNVLEADSHYPMACNANEFEVSNVENDGSLTKVSCHSNFADAKKAMKKSEDYVVRYNKSYSPTKIVAMNSGLAYTYPGRRDSLTMYLYQDAATGSSNQNKYKYTYLTENYEMNYYDTLTDYSSSLAEYGKGFIKISMNGFDGYCELEYTDLVPMKYIEKGIPIYLGGNNTYNGEDVYKVKLEQNYYALEKSGNYTDLVFHYNMAYPDEDEDGLVCISNSIHIDNAQNYLDAGMKTGVKYYSNDGINFYSDRYMSKLVAQVYGYYQFLSVRSKTDISGKTLDAFLKSIKGSSVMMDEGQSFINAQNNYGSNALIIYSMACQESGYGTSYYSSDRYNLFGWGAYDSNPGHASGYESVEQCINQHMGRNLNWFMDCFNWRYAGTCVGNKGTGFNMQYASDPYWGAKIAAIAYKIDKYSCNNNGKLTDYKKYATGVVDKNYNPCFGIKTSDWNTPIYKKATGDSVLHYSKFNDNYQKDLTVAITGKVGNRYQINLANPMIDGSLYIDDGIVKYDWNSSVGYIDCDRVTLMGDVEQEQPRGEATYEPFTSLRGITLNNNTLHIEGVGGIQGLDFNKNDTSIKHEVIFYNVENLEDTYSFTANNTSISGYDLNDGYNYDYVGFSLDINLNADIIPKGSYYISLKTTNSGRSCETVLRSANDLYSHIVAKRNNTNYRITSNYLYNYRIEFDIFNTGLDYSKINKPSSRNSLVSFDDISISDDGILNISGHGMIYYLNYNNVKNIKYVVYLVKDDGTVLPLTTELADNRFDYKSQLNSSYNLDYISFKSSIDMSGVVGNYNIILEINNGGYRDFVEFINMAELDMPSLHNDNFDISILTSKIRSRLYIVAKEVD